MEKDELNDLLREVCRDEILKDARPTLTTLKALHAERPLLVLALDQAIGAITELTVATAREARLVEALEHYEDPAHWSQIRNNNGNGEFLPVRYSDGNNPNAHGRDVAAIALNENIVRCSHGFDVLNDAGETIGHFDTAAEALAEYRGEK